LRPARTNAKSHFAKHGHCSGRLPHGQRLWRVLDGLAAQERALGACYFVAARNSRFAEGRTRTRRHCSSARGRFLAAANQGMARDACGASRTVNNFLLHLECAASLAQPTVRRHFPKGRAHASWRKVEAAALRPTRPLRAGLCASGRRPSRTFTNPRNAWAVGRMFLETFEGTRRYSHQKNESVARSVPPGALPIRIARGTMHCSLPLPVPLNLSAVAWPNGPYYTEGKGRARNSLVEKQRVQGSISAQVFERILCPSVSCARCFCDMANPGRTPPWAS
jgi:hypothetical protein